MRMLLAAALVASLTAFAQPAAAKDVPVPSRCDASVNQQLAGLISNDDAGPVDNVMVCGTTIGPSRPQRAGPHGGHQLLPLRIPLPEGRSAIVEVVSNDALDGSVTAPKGAHVIAYGQYFHTSPRQRPFVAGIHDVHCATHRGADNGWVVVNGAKYPRQACSR
jgi:hypothetical protein